MNPRCLGSVLLGGLAFTSVLGAESHPMTRVPVKVPKRVRTAHLNVPLSFEVNRGQTDPAVRFMARGSGFDAFLTPAETVLSLKAGDGYSRPQAGNALGKETRTRKGTVLRMKMVGANSAPDVVGERKLPSESNYLRGKDRSNWIRHVSHYAQVRYKAVYPGVDAVYYGNNRQLEYDLVVAAGASPKQIRMSIDGADKVRVDRAGDLVVSTAYGELRQHRPVVYQEIAGARKPVAGRYVVASANGALDPVVGFELGKYDHSKPVVIDPVLVWSTYLGGSQNDEGNGIAVDADGGVYVTGATESPDFPVTSGAIQVELNGTSDAFVTKLTNDGSALIYSTYLGGSGEEVSYSIAVGASGRAYITGKTNSLDYPIASPPKTDPEQPVYGGGPWDMFVSALSADGSELFYSTYMGGYIAIKPGEVNDTDIAYGIALDGPGNAYVTGMTNSDHFPTVNAVQPAFGGGPQDAVVFKLNVLGRLDFSSYLGGGALNYNGGTDFGAGVDTGWAVAVDPAGYVYVAGATSSKNFPTLSSLQRVNRSVRRTDPDAFIAKFIPGGKQLQYCTYLGGNSSDSALAIAADAEGNAYVTGVTRSTNFPTANAIHGSPQGADDVFFTKINSAGFQLMCSTYLGGADNDEGHGIAVDTAGNVVITGATTSVDFPVTHAMQARFGGLYDTFVLKIDATCRTLLYSGYFGSNNQDYGNGVAVDADGNAYVVGTTFENTFPVTSGAFQTTFGGGDSDAFVAKITDDQIVQAGGKIRCPKKLNFGRCPVGTTVTKTIVIKNVGKETLTGTVHALPAGPFKVDSSGGAFQLGRKGKATIRILCKADAREVEHETLYIESSDPQHPITIVNLQVKGF